MKSYFKLFVAVFFILAAVRATSAIDFTVSGKVRYSDNNEIVTSGSVKAYDHTTGALLSVTQIEPTGDFLLGVHRALQGQTDVIGIANNEPEATFIPTFFPDKISPVEATSLTTSTNQTGVDIYVRRSQNGGGFPITSNISGLILDKNNQPVKDAIVYAQRENQYYGYGVTNARGEYRIVNLPVGDFILVAHKVANQSDLMPVTLNENGLNGVNFEMNKLNNNTILTSVPDKFSLSQNFPNPFNPTTVIKYTVPVNSAVSLKVYNSTGQVVETLADGMQDAGSYEVSFNAANLSSGVYYYRLIAGTFATTKKMTLIK